MHTNHQEIDLDKSVFDSIFNGVGMPPAYSTDLLQAMLVAEKVNLFQYIILTSDMHANRIVYHAFHKGWQKRGEHITSKDFLDNQFLISSESLSQLICKAALLLFGTKNEKTITTDQSSSSRFTITS